MRTKLRVILYLMPFLMLFFLLAGSKAEGVVVVVSFPGQPSTMCLFDVQSAVQGPITETGCAINIIDEYNSCVAQCGWQDRPHLIAPCEQCCSDNRSFALEWCDTYVPMSGPVDLPYGPSSNSGDCGAGEGCKAVCLEGQAAGAHCAGDLPVCTCEGEPDLESQARGISAVVWEGTPHTQAPMPSLMWPRFHPADGTYMGCAHRNSLEIAPENATVFPDISECSCDYYSGKLTYDDWRDCYYTQQQNN